MIRFQEEPQNATYLKLYTRYCYSFFFFFLLKTQLISEKGTSKHSKGQNSLAGKIACENKIGSFLALPSHIHSFSLSSKRSRNNELITECLFDTC